MKTDQRTLRKAEQYRNDLCSILDMTISDLIGDNRKQPLPMKRQIMAMMINRRFGDKISLKTIGHDLMGYAYAGSHAMVLRSEDAVQGWLRSKRKDQAQALMDKATGFDQVWEQRRMHINISDSIDASISKTENEETLRYVPNALAEQRGAKLMKRLHIGVFATSVATLMMLAHMVMRLIQFS